MLLLSEPLPLRTTRSLGDYSDDAILPEIFGDLSNAPFPLIRLTDSKFFVCDHPAEVTQVFVDKQLAQDWAMLLDSDGSRTWTAILFAAPVAPGAIVSACGKGRLDDDTGELITNPGNIVQRVMQIAGRADDFSQFAAECSALNLQGAGRIASRQAIKLQVDQIMQSFAAIWTPTGARLYPSAATPSPILDLDKSEVKDIQVTASATDCADILLLGYDVADANGRAQHFMRLEASPQRYGGLIKEVTYPWLRTPANAEAIGRPVLQRLAGARYDVTGTSTRDSIRPGMWIRPVANPAWPLDGDDPVIMALSVEIEENSDSVRVAGETIIGELPVITVTAHSIALPDTIEAGIDVTVRDGIATFTFLDTDRRPIAGARVSLDGAAPKTTDAQGHVSFPITAGNTYELAFEAPGFVPFTVMVPL